MIIVKKISILLLVPALSFCFRAVKPMESAASFQEAYVQVIIKSKPFDLSEPSQLLESIKALQAKNLPPKAIAEALRASLKNAGKNLCYMTSYLPVQSEQISHVNILYFLDETCNRDTVTIILSAINTEEEACEFILSIENGPSGLERMLRKNYQDCALPMINLLWKNDARIKVSQPGFFIGINIETIVMNEMVKKERKKLESPKCFCWSNSIEEEISDEMVLKAVFNELKTHLSKNPLDCEGWLGFFK